MNTINKCNEVELLCEDIAGIENTVGVDISPAVVADRINELVNFLNQAINGINNEEEKWELFSKLSNLFDEWNYEINSDNLRNLLNDCPSLDVFLNSCFRTNSKVTEESILEMSNDPFTREILMLYAVLTDKIVVDDEEALKSYEGEYDYFKDVRHNVESLSHQDTLSCFKQMELCKKNNDVKTLNKLRKKVAEGHLHFVIWEAKKHYCPSIDMLDLIQEGNVGLMNAIDNFDYRKGYRFVTFAWWSIRGAIVRFIEKNISLVSISNRQIENAERINKIKYELLQEKGSCSLDDLAKRTGNSIEKLRDLENCQVNVVSLSTPIGEHDDSLEALIEDTAAVNPVVEVEKTALKEVLNGGLGRLSREYEFIIRMRFGIPKKNADNTYFKRAHTLSEVAKVFNTSLENIRQKEQRALKALRNFRTIESFYLEKEEDTVYSRKTLQDIMQCNDDEFVFIKDIIYNNENFKRVMCDAHGINLDCVYNYEDVCTYGFYQIKLAKKLEVARRNKSKNLQELLECDAEVYDEIISYINSDINIYQILMSIFGGDFERKINVLFLPMKLKKQLDFVLVKLKEKAEEISGKEDVKYTNRTLQEILSCSFEFLEYLLNILEDGSNYKNILVAVHGENLDQPFEKEKLNSAISSKYYSIIFRCRSIEAVFQAELGKTLQEILGCDEEIFGQVKEFVYAREKARNMLVAVFGDGLEKVKNYQVLNSSNNKYFNVIMGIIRRHVDKRLNVECEVSDSRNGKTR